MRLGIIVYSDDSETVWNAFRFANLALKKGDTVSVFLLAKGVESESLDTDKFSVTQQMWDFAANEGKIYACGTCLKIRGSDSTGLCPLSTMEDLYRIVQESDRVVSF